MAIERLLDPSWVLTHDLETVGKSSRSGRPVLQVKAKARPFRTRSGSPWNMASERDLVVDAERGFLHLEAALLDGEPYDVLELNEVVIDPDLPADVFSVAIPPGAYVTDTTADGPMRFRRPPTAGWVSHFRRRHP